MDGKDIYLEGAYGSEESLTHYDDVVRDWLLRQGDVSRVGLTIDDLAILYLKHAESYYVKDGKPTSEVAWSPINSGSFELPCFPLPWHLFSWSYTDFVSGMHLINMDIYFGAIRLHDPRSIGSKFH
jgi:hypothetical protein